MNLILLILATIISLSQARTVRWTAAGGTPLWDFANNWDCLCVPSASDDVIIDLANIPGNVRIGGSVATCNSLTIGGTSSFGQMLTVQGQLTIGAGGGKINTNGQLILDSAPSLPLSCAGLFDGGKGLSFISGNLAGPGSFSFTTLNLTSPALKQFSATVSISNYLNVLPGVGSPGTVTISAGTLTISNSAVFATEESLTLSVEGTGAFNVLGSISFAATVASKTLTFRGFSTVANLTTKGGTVVVNDGSSFSQVALGGGSVLTLIGAPDSKRTFGVVTGLGLVSIQGGTNVFNGMSVGTVNLNSGYLVTDSSISITSLTINGGNLQGNGQVSASSLTLANAQIFSVSLSAASITISGFTTFTGAQLQITGTGSVTQSSQFTMASASTVTVQSGASISQTADFKILPSGTEQPSLFVNNGQWNVGGRLTVVVNVQGSGTWSLGANAYLTATGINFAAGTLAISNRATFYCDGAVVSVGTVNGNSGGIITVSNKQFIATTLNVAVFNHQGGNTQFNTGVIGNLTVVSGNCNVTQSATVTNLMFQGGNLNGQSSTSTTVSATNTLLQTTSLKNLNTINVVSTVLRFLCKGPQSLCQFFINDANLGNR